MKIELSVSPGIDLARRSAASIISGIASFAFARAARSASSFWLCASTSARSASDAYIWSSNGDAPRNQPPANNATTTSVVRIAESGCRVHCESPVVASASSTSASSSSWNRSENASSLMCIVMLAVYPPPAMFTEPGNASTKPGS